MGEPARETSWDDVRDVDPEQLMLIPCGFDAHRTAAEWTELSGARPAWFDELRAVREGEVYALNGSAYFSRPGPRVIDGIALLAELFDPGVFSDEVPAGAWLPVAARQPR
jgi:iron complex transport system substrate-binding protein